MKRTNVVLDEELLERARRVTGERTYAATIARALQEVVRRYDFQRALAEYESEVKKGGFFWPGYLEEIRPNADSARRKQVVSASEKRAPRNRERKRAAR